MLWICNQEKTMTIFLHKVYLNIGQAFPYFLLGRNHNTCLVF